MKFTKMHGAGNDYVYIDCFSQQVPKDPAATAREVSHRRFGVGGDGMILIRPSDRADAWMQMFNSDGSESEMCGNGIRCVAKYIFDHRIATGSTLNIESGGEVLSVSVNAGSGGTAESIAVDMGPPVLEPARIPTTLGTDAPVIGMPFQVVDPATGQSVTVEVTCVSMGNPHCVIFVPEATDALVAGLGPVIESDPRFPNRTNVEFVEVISRSEVRQRTWERGSGETWACGTGASAVCVAGVLTDRTERSIVNHLTGGDLSLDWNCETGHVIMTGPAEEVFSGVWPVESR